MYIRDLSLVHSSSYFVLEALSREFRTGVPWELLYANDLAVIGNTLEECVSKLKAWKEGMENKGQRVNMKKTMLMVLMFSVTGAFPCAVCRDGVGLSKAIKCSQCKLWVHKRCSGIQGRIVANPN